MSQQHEQQQQSAATPAEELPATRQIKLKLREEHSDYIADKARKDSSADGGVTSAKQHNSSNTSSISDAEISFCSIKRALSPPRKPSPRPETAVEEESAPGPKQGCMLFSNVMTILGSEPAFLGGLELGGVDFCPNPI